MPASKLLPVPYYTQPDATTCQSTVLKMMASYLEREVTPGGTAGATPIRDIKTDINTNPARPDTKYQNAHANFKWWLETKFPNLTFTYMSTKDSIEATETIVKSINGGMPVLVSVSHARVPGHIVLVVGYENYERNRSTANFKWIVHDPYGQFDPLLMSDAYGKNRHSRGMSLVSGDELGPGRNVGLEPDAISRRRTGDGSAGTYFLLFPDAMRSVQ